MSGTDRRAELAQKKAKLAALREERLKKEEYQFKVPPLIANLPSVDTESVDGILKELGVTDNIEANQKVNHEQLKKSVDSITLNSNSKCVEKFQPNLSMSEIVQCTVNAQEPITYSKKVQTNEVNSSKLHSPTVERWNGDTSRTFLALQSYEWDDEISANPYDENDSHLLGMTQFIKNLEHNKSVRFNHVETPTKPLPPRDLTDEEKQETMETETFRDFFLRTSRVVQRALEDPNDIFFDYSGAEREEDAQGKHQLVKYIGEFRDEAYVPSGGRSAVVALDWSAVHPELLLAAYQPRKNNGAGECNGTSVGDSFCCIWNMKYRQTALQSIFTYQVDITAATLTEFHPSVVIGGTKGGQIVLWDSRVGRRTPVQMTHLVGGGAAHVEAITDVTMTGTRNANSLVSVSSEGRLCVWSLDMLGAPIQALDLIPAIPSAAGIKRSNAITPTCLAFLPGLDPGRFLVGAQDGSVYFGSRNEKNPGLTAQFEGHKAPVTSVSVLAGVEAGTLTEDGTMLAGVASGGPLFVTTGMDCSMRLWSVREPPAYPLLAYEDRNDYFVGCDASPIHPALFATTDLSGCLDFWSLNSDHEYPTASAQVEGDTLLNRCRFHKKGFHVAVGDDDGGVRLFELHENLAMPKQDEGIQLNRLVRDLSNTAAEEHDVRNRSHSHSHMH